MRDTIRCDADGEDDREGRDLMYLRLPSNDQRDDKHRRSMWVQLRT